MTIFNNTPVEAYYTVSYGNDVECGSLGGRESVTSTNWDKQPKLKVVFSGLGGNPPTPGHPFWITIPQTGTGLAVTIGISQE
jgi:hypothetical protein